MQDAQILIFDAKNSSKEEFIKKHPHPFLVQYSEESSEIANQQLIFSTVAITNIKELIKLAMNMKKISSVHTISKSKRNPFSSKIIVGRTSSQDIVIQNTSISKYHAYFEIKDGQYLLVDRGSINGSSLNLEMLESNIQRVVNDNDVVSFANNSYTFYTPETAYNIFRQTDSFNYESMLAS